MSHFDEKAGTIDCKTDKYTWTQTIDEVQVTVPVPAGTKGRDVEVVIKPNYLKVKLKSQPKSIIDGELCSSVKKGDCLWTLEDNKEVRILLAKATAHDSWSGLIKGEEVDPFTAEEMKKKMMLEKFQRENPGFDFSGATFSGQVPEDPKNFMKFD
jgi:hypothetical protein